MKRPVQALLLALSGLGLLQVSVLTDVYLRYVKEGMRPLLVASGIVLLVLGLAEAWSSYRNRGKPQAPPSHDSHTHSHDSHTHDSDSDSDTHDHTTPPLVAWLLFLPALSLLFFAPPALGAYTASREAPKAVTAQQDDFDPLPATSPLPITLGDFTRRVQQDRTKAIAGRTVLMTGFVTPGEDADTWYLTRLLLSCCAADAQSLKVPVHGVPAPKSDTWVQVTGTWHPAGTLGTASAEAGLDARAVTPIDRPSNGYTDSLPLTAPPS